jgi:hypothetical protein
MFVEVTDMAVDPRLFDISGVARWTDVARHLGDGDPLDACEYPPKRAFDASDLLGDLRLVAQADRLRPARERLCS